MDLNIKTETIKELILGYIYARSLTESQIVEAFFASDINNYNIGLFIEKLQEFGRNIDKECA